MRFVFGLVILAVGLAPLPFGANRPWAWSLLALVVGLAILIAAVRGLRNAGAFPIPFGRYRVLAVGFFLLAGWILVQAMPWTPQFLHDPSWAAAAEALGTPYRGAISADPQATLDSLMRFLTYGGIFWLGMQMGGHDRAARLMMRLIVLFCVIYAVYGLSMYLSGTFKVLWYDKWVSVDALTATFLNRNHLVTYMGIGIILALSQLIEVLHRSISGLSLRTRSGFFALLEAIDLRFAFLVISLGILMTAVVMAGSRAGLAGIAIGIAVMLAALAGHRQISPSRAVRFGILVGIGIFVVVAFSGNWLLKRMAMTGTHLAERLDLFDRILGALADRPLLGTGLGTFEDVFRSYRGADGLYYKAPVFDYAHNPVLEFALEAGVPALIVLLLIFAVISGVQFRGVGRRQYNAGIPAAGLGITSLVLVHSMVEFSIQIPAVAATYLLVTGAAFAQAWPHAARTPDPNRGPAESGRAESGRAEPPAENAKRALPGY